MNNIKKHVLDATIVAKKHYLCKLKDIIKADEA
jgi:hypothetical protein